MKKIDELIKLKEESEFNLEIDERGAQIHREYFKLLKNNASDVELSRYLKGLTEDELMNFYKKFPVSPYLVTLKKLCNM